MSQASQSMDEHLRQMIEQAGLLEKRLHRHGRKARVGTASGMTPPRLS